MPNQSMSLKEAAALAGRIAPEMGYELVDCELVKEPTGRFLRIFIDKPEGGITLDDLESFHRKILPLVERVDYDYMEVSSPGADRPLKSERDFARAEGQRVELKTYRPIDGAKVFQGALIGLVDGKIGLTDASGTEHWFEKKDAAIVRLMVEFDEEALDQLLPDE